MEIPTIKDYSSPHNNIQKEISMAGPSNKKTSGKINSKSSDGAVPEFIQKLFRMLENTAFQNTFCWSPDGSTFVVKDTNEFSKSILPKHFKHCNFASFVRQLNKYDFHKVRNSDDGSRPFGDQAWEFVHPKFKRDRKDLLEEIRRKTPGKSKKDESNTFTKEGSNKATTTSAASVSATVTSEMMKVNTKNSLASSSQLEDMKCTTEQLQTQINELQQYRIELEKKLQQLSNTDYTIIQELIGLGKNMELKDKLILDFFSKQIETNKETSKENPKLEIQELLNSFLNISKQNSTQLDRITQQLQTQWTGSNVKVKEESILDVTMSSLQQTPTTSNDNSISQQLETSNNSSTIPPTIPSQQTIGSFNVPVSVASAAVSMNAGSLIGSPLKTADGLTFVTLGRLSSNTTLKDNRPAIEISTTEHQVPSLLTQTKALSQQQDINLNNVGSTSTIVPSSSQQPPSTSSSSIISDSQNGAVSLKRKMNIAGWTVPPRVLLVDDDSVYRDLSGRLLQIIGCSIDLAKDGVEALRKMGLEKYDLILMDIVMPNLDGISATRNIRQYDALTPIISMTSNFTDSDIMQYIGSGMTDILPKPFSKKTLYSMLEKYCAHLKAIQRVHRVQDQNIPPTLSTLSLPAPTSSSSSSSILQHNNMNNDMNNDNKNSNSNDNSDNNINNDSNNNNNSSTNNSNTTCNDINIQNTDAETNNNDNKINNLTSQRQQQFQSQVSLSTSTSNLTQVFPMTPYSFPISMDTVSIDSTSSFTNNVPQSQLPTNGAPSVTNLTVWPNVDKQSILVTSSSSYRPMIAPTIIPSNDGKFAWSLPASNSIEMNNKRRRLNNED